MLLPVVTLRAESSQTTASRFLQLDQRLAAASSRSEQVRALLSGKQRLFTTPFVCQGRLTTESGEPVSTADRAAQSTLYYTPFAGSRVALYTGTTWKVFTFSEVSLSLSGLTPDTNYDVFLYDNAGTLAMELSTAWTSNTARAAAVGLTEGVYTLTSDPTRRLVGTIRAVTATTVEDSATKRLVWNYYHRLNRHMAVTETADTWVYTSTTLRQTRASTNNQVEWVLGANEAIARAFSAHLSIGDATPRATEPTIIGASSTASNSQLKGIENDSTMIQQSVSQYDAYTGLGYEYLSWNERGVTGNTFYGDNGSDDRIRPGMIAFIEN